MSPQKADTYIEILKYAQGKTTFDRGGIEDEFPDHKWLIQRCYNEGLFVGAGVTGVSAQSYGARLHLLEHEELQKDRKSSRGAMIIATISILLTLVSIVYSILSVQKVIVTTPVTVIESSKQG